MTRRTIDTDAVGDNRAETIGVYLVSETALAWLVKSNDTGKQGWIAKSLGEMSDDGKELTAPYWALRDKELV